MPAEYAWCSLEFARFFFCFPLFFYYNNSKLVVPFISNIIIITHKNKSHDDYVTYIILGTF